jgi:hypothetical protein
LTLYNNNETTTERIHHHVEENDRWRPAFAAQTTQLETAATRRGEARQRWNEEKLTERI